MKISKKDLLKETKISYGQLYRWKREGLIPEDWFMKQSSSTGQETYFPKEKILTRVQRILELKDQFSLEELSNILSPESSERVFHEDELDQFEEIDVPLIAEFMDTLERDEFFYKEILVLMALSRLKREEQLTDEIMHIMIQSMLSLIQNMQNISYQLQLLRIDKDYYLMLNSEQETVLLDSRMECIRSISLSELSNELKLKYKDAFNFEL